MNNVQIGTARILPDGSIELVMPPNSSSGKELREQIEAGFVYGLTLIPIVNPAVDGNLIGRVTNESPIRDVVSDLIGSADKALDNFMGKRLPDGGRSFPFPREEEIVDRNTPGRSTTDPKD